jgi:hypothetical protein
LSAKPQPYLAQRMECRIMPVSISWASISQLTRLPSLPSESFDMKKLSSLCSLFTLIVSFPILQAAAQAEDVKWESLFNGKNLAGWVAVNDVDFVVTNGNLRLVRGMGWLRTEKQYKDFIFEAEWRALVPQYDSGFFIRADLEGKPWPKEVWQVNLQGAALGGLVKGNKTVVPAETPPAPLNQWVKFRIEVRDKKITLDVAGERAWEFAGLDAERGGYIGIQAENKSFDFRNIRIQELSR